MKIDPALEAKIVHTADCRCVDCWRRHKGPFEEFADEEAFQAAVMKLAKSLLWECYHTRDSRKSRKGYPDLTCWRERVFFAELKTETGVVTPDQETTLEGLRKAGSEVYLFRPSNWDEIVRVLA